MRPYVAQQPKLGWRTPGAWIPIGGGRMGSRLESAPRRFAAVCVSIRRLAVGLGLLAMLLAAPAIADLDSGWQAYQRGDYGSAAAIWRPLAEAGDPVAQFNLGFLHHRGEGVAQDYEAAVFWWTRAANQGAIKAQHNLGLAYFNGEGVDQDNEQARTWIEMAANAGFPRAQYVLGKMYLYSDELGFGEPDEVKAFEWIYKAAEAGDYRAQYNLGKMYRDGRGISADDERSAYWFQQAAFQGYAKAQNHLGVRYARGQGIEQDDVRALKWVWLAAAQGDKDAIANRQSLLIRMSSPQIAEAKRMIQEDGPTYRPTNASASTIIVESTEGAPPLPITPAPAPEPAADETVVVEMVETTEAATEIPPPPPPEPAPESTTPTEVAAVPASGKVFWVQLGSFREEGRGEAWWSTIRGAQSALLGDLSHEISPVDLGSGMGLWYRLRVGPFTDAAGAKDLCASLKDGGYDCFVARR